MKNTFLTLLFAVIVSFTFADNDKNTSEASKASASMIEITGSVVDLTSGEALVGVEIKIEGTDQKVYSDFDGNFKFEDIKPGKYNLVASYISYKGSLIENFSADQDNHEVKIKLEEEN
jgi:hypothetical protein